MAAATMRRLRRALWTGLGYLASLAAIANASSGYAAVARYSEISVKAAFLYHFCNYIEWPAIEGRPERGDLEIAVIGNRALAAELGKVLPGRRVGSRALRVRQVDSSDQLAQAAVLFIGNDIRASSFAQWVAATRDQPILIVAERPEALDKGAMINFVMADGRVRFELAPAATEARGLKLSSRLFPIALRIKEGG